MRMQTLLARLRAETRFHHLRLERDLAVLREDVTPAEHRELVRRLYGFYRPWEERAVPVLEAGHPGVMRGRAKTPLLARDLGRLGEPPEALDRLPHCSRLPSLTTLPMALGSMYVLEGATLGGQVVSRHLARTLGPTAGISFFDSYGPEVGPMWRRFGEALTAHAGPETDETIVDSARETFLRLHDWLVPEGGLA
jgi:heme oxygenase